MDRFRADNPSLDVTCCATAEEVADGADALVLVTEWPEYRELDWERLAKSMRGAFLLDGRHVLDRGRLTRAGFRYAGLSG
jgi:UDPglucose 6-dehydrogenase